MTSYQRLRLLLNSSLDANQKLVAIALSDHMSDTRGYALCGVTRLALLTSLSERTVQRVLNQGDGVWLKRDMKPGAKQYPTYILWSKLPNNQATGDNVSHVPDGHMCQSDACDGESQVTEESSTGDSLSKEGCQPVQEQVTACHPKPTIKPTREADTKPARETHPAQPSPQPIPEAKPVAPPPKKPLFACWAEPPKPAVVEEEPEEEDPLPADHLLLLTTRPDGSPALSMAVAAPLATALLSGGYATPADLELATMDDVAKVVGGKQKMNLINQSLVAWGTKLLLSTRAMVEDIRARARNGKLDLSPVEEFLLKKSHIKLSEVRDANDFACYTLSQRIDAARSTL